MKINLLSAYFQTIFRKVLTGVILLLAVNGNARTNHFHFYMKNNPVLIKDTNITSTPVFPVLYTNLMVPDQQNLNLVDGVATAFDNIFSASVDADDAMKLWNFDENIAEIRNDTALAIEFRPVPKTTDTIFYRLYLRQQPYTLKIFSQHFSGMIPAKAWLIDNYLNTKKRINLFDTTFYNFIPNNDINSYRNRFMLIINRQLEADAIAITKVLNQNNPGISGNINSNIQTSKSCITIFPNPVINSYAMLRFNNMPPGKYEISIFNLKGVRIGNSIILHNYTSANYPLPLKNELPAGEYFIQIRNTTKCAIILKMNKLR